jgi:hypothetical protein
MSPVVGPARKEPARLRPAPAKSLAINGFDRGVDLAQAVVVLVGSPSIDRMLPVQ